MKTLSIRQPWAQLVVTPSMKDIENRSWRTNFRGRVLVHASGKLDDRGIPNCLTAEQQRLIPDLFGWVDKGFLCHAIIGSVEIVNCVKGHWSPWAEKDGWNWILKNPVLFSEPILGVKGKLSFWEYTGLPVSALLQEIEVLPDLELEE